MVRMQIVRAVSGQEIIKTPEGKCYAVIGYENGGLVVAPFPTDIFDACYAQQGEEVDCNCEIKRVDNQW